MWGWQQAEPLKGVWRRSQTSILNDPLPAPPPEKSNQICVNPRNTIWHMSTQDHPVATALDLYKMKGKTSFLRCLKEFGGFIWLTLTRYFTTKLQETFGGREPRRAGCTNAHLTIWLANRGLTLTAQLTRCRVARSPVN